MEWQEEGARKEEEETPSTVVSSKPATTTSPSNANLQQQVSWARGPSAGGWASARRAFSMVLHLHHVWINTLGGSFEAQSIQIGFSYDGRGSNHLPNVWSLCNQEDR